MCYIVYEYYRDDRAMLETHFDDLAQALQYARRMEAEDPAAYCDVYHS